MAHCVDPCASESRPRTCGGSQAAAGRNLIPNGALRAYGGAWPFVCSVKVCE